MKLELDDLLSKTVGSGILLHDNLMSLNSPAKQLKFVIRSVDGRFIIRNNDDLFAKLYIFYDSAAIKFAPT